MNIFPEVFPNEFVDAINSLNYHEDKRDVLYKRIVDLGMSTECIDVVLSNFIDAQWDKKVENTLIYNNGKFLLDKTIIKDTETNKKYKLFCEANIEKNYNNVKLEFKISSEDFCFSDNGDYNTQTSDGVHLIICGTKKYSYNSIFLFPKIINSKTVVIPVDVLNELNAEIDASFIQATYSAVKNGYIITATLKEKFLKKHNLNEYFYLGLVISNCSSDTHKRKAELILSNPISEWYNPICFVKIKLQ